MSHKATTWLSGIAPDQMSAGAFRVLFHLCDCHNPSDGCFPSQAYLIEKTGLSNGGLNKVLNHLEQKGLISRHRRVDKQTRKKRPTRYMLAFEKGFQPVLPADANDAGDLEEPSPLSGDGTISTLGAIPSPLQERNHLHPSGDKPVKEPVRNQRAREGAEQSPGDVAQFWAKQIRQNKLVVSSAVNISTARLMLELELVTAAQLRQLGIAF